MARIGRHGVLGADIAVVPEKWLVTARFDQMLPKVVNPNATLWNWSMFHSKALLICPVDGLGLPYYVCLSSFMQPAPEFNVSQPGKRLHILVVDDDPLFRSLMVGVLRQDFDVTVACDGSDGFYRALDRRPDVTVLDLQMPGWDGLKTLRAFRSHPLLAEVKVMVLTSDSSRETVLAAIHAGADDYTIKTAFSRDEFREKLDRLTRISRNETEMDAIIAQAMAAPTSPRPRLGEDRSDELAPASSRRPLTGTVELLQEAIDAWE